MQQLQTSLYSNTVAVLTHLAATVPKILRVEVAGVHPRAGRVNSAQESLVVVYKLFRVS